MRARSVYQPLGVLVGIAAAVALTAFGITEEVPVGDVEGVVLYREGFIPVPNAEVHIQSSGHDLGDVAPYHRATKADANGKFVFHNVPRTYVTVTSLVQGYSGSTWHVIEKRKETVLVKLDWLGDYLQLGTNQPVFTPDESPTIVMNGLTRRSTVPIKLFKFDDKTVFQERNAYSLSRNIAYNRYMDIAPEKEPEPFFQVEHKLTSQQLQGRFAETFELPKLKEGLYILRAEVDGVQRHLWINVSRLGLIAKVSPHGVMGFVVDIASGRPVPGVDVDVYGAKGRRALGKTNENGVVEYVGSPKESDSHVLAASKGDSKAFAMFYWYPDSDGQAAAVHIETDRSIYRPGDNVKFKGFVRVPTADGYRLPNFKSAQVTVFDPDETKIKTEKTTVSSLGGFHTSFDTLPDLTGSYHVQVEIDGQTFDEYVPILSYRKSEFKITVVPERPYYIVGQVAKFVVKAEYFTGEPVVGVELNAWAERSKTWRWSPFDEEDYDYWGYGDGTYGGEYIEQFKATTDEYGVAIVTVPTKRPKVENRWETEDDLVYSLNVSAEDASGRYFSGDGKVDVVRGDVDLEAALDDYVVEPGRPASLRLRAKDYATGRPAFGTTVQVEFGEEQWTRNKSKKKVLQRKTVRLDQQGEATVTVTAPNTGDFYVSATLRDKGGRTVRAEDRFWAYTYGGRFRGPAPKMQLVLDKKQYEVGDLANLVLRTAKPGGTALVTVEADRVLWSRTVPLDTESTQLSIPVGKQFRPNVSVNVAYVREKSFSSASRTLSVDLARDTLSVMIAPSVKETLPGGTVKYQVTTRDSKGNPVPADVAVSVVDEAVYAIREDNSDPVKSFFPRRWSSVSTVYSFSEVYLDGDDKSGLELQIRRDFRDTAFWAPSVETDKDGKATLEVKLPENLTSWRATATAVTADAQSGKARTQVLARKPIMVRLGTPAFMVQDETQTIGATVMNETDQRRSVRVRAEASGLTVTGQTSQTITIDARKSVRVQWTVQANSPGEAKMLVSAVSNGPGMNDALERSFHVKTNGPTYTSFNAGDTTSGTTFDVVVRNKAQTGVLEISLTPTLLGSLVGAIDGLVDYPYGCVEQTMSRFMPAMVVSRYLKASGAPQPELDKKIDEVAQMSQARLQSLQHSDGGFGWWANDESDPEMTALVLEGLYHAQHSGADINVQVRDRAIVWAKDFMKNERTKYFWRDDTVRLAYALALQGVDPSVWWLALPQRPDLESDADTLAWTVLAIKAAMGAVPKDAEKLQGSAYKRLVSLADVGETTASWDSKWWNEPTAIALQAVAKMDPHGDLAVKTMRFLTNRRQGRGWWSTRDTAQIILAAVEFLGAVREASGDFTATVTVGAGQPQVFRFKATDLTDQRTLTVPVSDLRQGKNSVRVTVSGKGRVYYSARLEQTVYDPSPRPQDSGNGLRIERQYFRMEAQRLEDGTIRLLPSEEPVASAKNGEVLHCRLTITSDREREFVMVHDPALSNSRFIDPGDSSEWDWDNWWSDQSYFDDHTAVFVRRLKAGTNVFEYAIRAEASGRSTALPATVSLMYQPDIRAATGSQGLQVRD